MSIVWRWDQGRLDYFQYDEIKQIAQALIAFDGQSLPRGGDPDTLRLTLEQFSEKPFAPNRDDYPVWRNYGRVFKCQLLASQIGGLLVCTDLCKKVATESIDVDDYLIHFANHFYHPSPIFEGYSTAVEQKFLAISIIKYLLANYSTTPYPYITLEEVADKIVGNNATGRESLSYYLGLKSTGYAFLGDSNRQIRELLIFISQFSFLKWADKKLYLDLSSKEEAFEIERSLKPFIAQRNSDPAIELLSMGSNISESKLSELTAASTINFMDQEFTEGNKIRVTHLRSERSGKLKDFYFSNIENPHICNMCRTDTIRVYPWADRIIELHHLLPLSSPIRFEKEGTTLKDLVGLCPSCHRATHKYYNKWLKSESIKDFRNYDEARNIYKEAKTAIVLI